MQSSAQPLSIFVVTAEESGDVLGADLARALVSAEDSVQLSGVGGTQRAAVFVGEAGLGSWFGGAPDVYVVYPDTRSGEEVSAMRIVPRDE